MHRVSRSVIVRRPRPLGHARRDGPDPGAVPHADAGRPHARGALAAPREAPRRNALRARPDQGGLDERRDRRPARRDRAQGRHPRPGDRSDEARRGGGRRGAVERRRGDRGRRRAHAAPHGQTVRRPLTASASRPPRSTASSAASRSAATARRCTRISRTRTRATSPRTPRTRSSLLRAVVYLGYKFNDHFVLNTELEYENAVVASDKDGEVEVEFAYIDYMHSRELQRPGRPRSSFRSGSSTSSTSRRRFSGPRGPDVDDVIIPTTWRELGGGLYGELGPFSYRAYAVNGLNAAGYTADEGIREGRSEGSEALATNFAVDGPRSTTPPFPGLLLGASVFSGDVGPGTMHAFGAGDRRA